MAEKSARKTTQETGVDQALLDAHYDAVDRAAATGRDDGGRPLAPVKAKPKVEDKAVKGSRE